MQDTPQGPVPLESSVPADGQLLLPATSHAARQVRSTLSEGSCSKHRTRYNVRPCRACMRLEAALAEVRNLRVCCLCV